MARSPDIFALEDDDDDDTTFASAEPEQFHFHIPSENMINGESMYLLVRIRMNRVWSVMLFMYRLHS